MLCYIIQLRKHWLYLGQKQWVSQTRLTSDYNVPFKKKRNEQVVQVISLSRLEYLLSGHSVVGWIVFWKKKSAASGFSKVWTVPWKVSRCLAGWIRPNLTPAWWSCAFTSLNSALRRANAAEQSQGICGSFSLYRTVVHVRGMCGESAASSGNSAAALAQLSDVCPEAAWLRGYDALCLRQACWQRFVAQDFLPKGSHEGSRIGALKQANQTYILSAGAIFLDVHCSYEFNVISSQGSALSLELHQPIRNLIL